MKLKYIDVLRGLAILGVLMVHCSHYGNNNYFPTKFSSIVDNGAMGVQLFYIASAFTLFLSMDRKFYTEKTPIKNFFIRRFFRIAPMYYIGICYFLFQDGFGGRFWLGDATNITVGNILANIFFVHGFNPYWLNSVVPGGWSIAIEMLFYCLVPFLFIKIKNTQQAFGFLIISLVLRMILSYFLNKIHIISSDWLWDNYLFFYLPNQLPIFALGILLYFIIRDNYKLSISPSLTILISLILILQFNGIHLLPLHVLFGIAFVIFGIGLSKSESNILINPILIHIGKISFSMYLVHFAVLHWLEKFHFVDFIVVSNSYTGIFNYSIRLLILIILSAIISTIFYRVIELPMQNIGKKIIGNK